MGDLQKLTDRIGERLARSVAIDDPRMRLQSYSPHYGAVDEQRLASILHRQANPEAIAWAHDHDVQRATGWRRVPGNPGLGMLSRVCVPIRFHRLHLGYLWIIDADESLTPGELRYAEHGAREAADIMYRDGLVSDLQRARERELIRDLLDEDHAIRTQALSGLAEDALMEIDSAAQVLVLDTTLPAGDGDRAGRADLALATARRLVPQRRSLHLVRPDHAILVVTCGRGVRTEDLAARIGAEYGRDTGLFRVGIGDEVASAAATHVSYRQALQAVRVGQVLAREGMVTWSGLGIYRLLVELKVDESGLDLLHPALTRLAEHRLLETLEVYLDLAGDAKATAEHLQVHRTTLYHRLSRIEEIGGVSLRSGTDRLTLHLGLKLGHLSGRL
ncbi:PucR family transcriptional regulator [Nonomuraea sediminis]|uniref:PucR family transcriptional regulator n=1 Tax=Nonomuraea sediminis TaxID=2835864 RepID=UPI001BDBBF45|nr:helix-turn-helix domain-containing protein [Nonomuraea sediminis]